MPAEERAGRALGVDRLQPGDHAFLAFSDDEDRWDVLTAFTQQGFARNEKVALLIDVGHSPAWVAARVTGGAAAARGALSERRLVVSSSPRFERGKFDAARLVEGVRRRIGTASAEGFSGLRSASEMTLALAPVDHLGQAVEYETALHAALFRGELNGDLSGRGYPRFTALCQWDARLFGQTEAMAAARDVHPVILLPRLGTLHAAIAGNRLILTGDSDLSSRAEWSRALRVLADRPNGTLVIDISDLSFFDAHSAGAVLRMAAALPEPRRLEVWCRSAQRRMLHTIGARSVARLSIVTKRL
jgi:MEDS: MEthanogen/methylotroph, DcmR Sensory domain